MCEILLWVLPVWFQRQAWQTRLTPYGAIARPWITYIQARHGRHEKALQAPGKVLILSVAG
ncbi:hypothetical protein [Ruegeria atlantica]|uniref:hypothetical protein n=1 Tax=Ruegeria atlantica TaxID=81569 RepID=UPI001480064F|nr:hypothetical protein [Ruegeria atlantica]